MKYELYLSAMGHLYAISVNLSPFADPQRRLRYVLYVLYHDGRYQPPDLQLKTIDPVAARANVAEDSYVFASLFEVESAAEDATIAAFAALTTKLADLCAPNTPDALAVLRTIAPGLPATLQLLRRPATRASRYEFWEAR